MVTSSNSSSLTLVAPGIALSDSSQGAVGGANQDLAESVAGGCGWTGVNVTAFASTGATGYRAALRPSREAAAVRGLGNIDGPVKSLRLPDVTEL